MRAYTGRGDDGTTGLFHGGRLGKDHPVPGALGDVDEAQAALGVARAEAEPDSELHRLLVHVQRDLYVLMAELATANEHRHRLVAGTTLVTPEMVQGLERVADDLVGRTELSPDFVLPGENRVSALLDMARAVVRRAERSAVPVVADGSSVLPYLNRLSSLVWALARCHEGDAMLARLEPNLADALPRRKQEEA